MLQGQKITARNYVAQACKGLSQYINKLHAKNSALDMAGMRFLISVLESSQHFALPDGGRVFDDVLKGLKGRSLRLPHDNISIEYHVPSNMFKTSKTAVMEASKRVVSAHEMTREQYTTMAHDNSFLVGFAKDVLGEYARILDNTRMEMSMYPTDVLSCYPDEERFILIMSTIYLDAVNDWSPISMTWALPCNNWEGGSRGVQPRKDTKDAIFFQGRPGMLTPNFFYYALKRRSSEDLLNDFFHDLAHEVYVVLELLEALSCVNVGAITHQEPLAPAVAQRRAKTGKLPIFETKRLSILFERKQTFKSRGPAGDRASPRQHMRRGHIRRLSGDRNIWVSPCVVGDPEAGIIEKTYEIG